MKIVHTYINNMYIDQFDETKECFADKWGLVSLAKMGHEVTLICGGNKKEKRKEYLWKGIRVVELPPLFEFNNTSRLLHGFIRELMTIDADIFHTHHYCSLIPEITVSIGQLRRIPTVLTFHNSLMEGDFLSRNLGRLYLLLMQPFLPFYSKCFFISHYLKHKFLFSLARNKTVVENYIGLPPSISMEREKNSILYVGRLTHQKGVDILIQAVNSVKSQYPFIKVYIVGEGDKRYTLHLKKIVRAFNLTNNIFFLGKKSGAEKWAFFFKSQLMVVPSRDEGFGNVVVEGMLCDLPVITSNKGALPEAGGGHTLIFDIKKPEELAERILSLLQNTLLREKISTDAKEYALKYTSSVGQRLSKEYASLLLPSSRKNG